MLEYVLAVVSFTLYILLLSLVSSSKRKLQIVKSLLSFIWYLPFWVYALSSVTIVNLIAFGNPFQAKDVWWIPVLGAPLIEESGKLISIYLLKRILRVSKNELLRLGGAIGAWVFFLENISYIWANAVTAQIMAFRLFPLHINSAILVTSALRDDFSRRRRVLLPLFAILLHGIHNYLAIIDFPLFVAFGFFSFGLFIVILWKTPLRQATPLGLPFHKSPSTSGFLEACSV